VTGAVEAHLAHLRRRNLRTGTINQRRLVLGRLRRFLDDVDLLAAEHDALVAFLDRGSLGPEARATETSHVRSFYGWAVLECLVAEDPSARLVRPRLRRRLPRPIDDRYLVRALDRAPDRVRPWLWLAAFAGLRAAEIAQLCREDVLDYHDPPVLFVVDGKGGKQRTVPLADDLLAELVTWPAPTRGWLFTRLDDRPGPVPAHLVSNLANRYLHGEGIPYTLHTLRHWFGTTMYRRTSDLRLVQELLGHSSPVTTAGYAAWSPAKAADAVRTLTVPDGAG
jgi:integrase